MEKLVQIYNDLPNSYQEFLEQYKDYFTDNISLLNQKISLHKKTSMDLDNFLFNGLNFSNSDFREIEKETNLKPLQVIAKVYDKLNQEVACDIVNINNSIQFGFDYEKFNLIPKRYEKFIVDIREYINRYEFDLNFWLDQNYSTYPNESELFNYASDLEIKKICLHYMHDIMKGYLNHKLSCDVDDTMMKTILVDLFSYYSFSRYTRNSIEEYFDMEVLIPIIKKLNVSFTMNFRYTLRNLGYNWV